MANLRETLTNAARAGAASMLGTADALDRLVDFPDSGFGILGQLDDFTDAARRGYRDLLTPGPGESPFNPPLPPPTVPPPPQGQCPVLYTVTYTWNDPIFGDNQSFTQTINGPNVRMDLGGTEIGEISLIRVVSDVQAGQIQRSYQVSPTRPPIELTSFTAVPADGSPDVCPEQGTPPPPFIEEPITYDPPTGPPIQITPIITFNPIFIDINNNPIIPITFVYADVDIRANLNLNLGGVTFNFGGGRDGGEGCCPPPQLPELPPADPEEIPEPDTEERIAGVIVTVTSISDDANFTEVGVPQGPALYFPDLGTVMFRLRTDGVLSWTAPIRIQNRRQFIPVNWREGAVDVAAQARTGVNFTLTIVYDDYVQNP